MSSSAALRLRIFIDGKYFHSGWKIHGGYDTERQLDFKLLAGWIAKQVTDKVGITTQYIGATFYTGVEDANGGQANSQSQQRLLGFLRMLEHVDGYKVVRLPRRNRSIRCSICNGESSFSQEKEVDTTITVDMLDGLYTNAFDVAVLISGDADLAPPVRYLNSHGVVTIVGHWHGEGFSDTLRVAAYSNIDLMLGNSAFGCNFNSATDAEDTGDNRVEKKLTTSDLLRHHKLVLSELSAAEVKFENGFVGRGFFIHRWRSSNREFASGNERELILDDLIGARLVESYYVESEGKTDVAVRVTDEGKDPTWFEMALILVADEIRNGIRRDLK